MNILVLGGGGREHALCWKIAQSPRCAALYCAPGNPGIAELATCVDLPFEPQPVIDFCRAQAIDMVVIGPEQPLVAGLADDLTAADVRCFGPSQSAAQLEGSKGFTKDLCAAHNIPTAAYQRFTEARAAHAYVLAQGTPIVIKADGLAAGKGVVVAMTQDEAHSAIEAMFALPGASLVIEEFLEGEEASFFVLCDGTTALPLASAQDHKRVGDGDTGPNTGGMGAYSPAPVMTPEMTERVMTEIIHPTLAAMRKNAMPFNGVLFAGLMLTRTGPKLIEYNVRFGDPECQTLMLRLASDLVPALVAACDGRLHDIALAWSDAVTLCVVMAAEGYPGTPRRGDVIAGLDAAGTDPQVTIFHAGTAQHKGAVVSNGGRVLNICARAATVASARTHAYAALAKIDWPTGFYRHDIGARALHQGEAQ